ncbi:MAG: aminotransferase class V-fold PLP-dependent enzyme [Alphaproteobacteria bacterium]|nr:aminotransferase class V-fold PLP-dependent enzyme [Alphaproteobacteria bacterium]
MSPPRIYCDYNATAPLRPEARLAISDAFAEGGNPSSVHAEGRRARARLEAARETVAACIGACREDLVFVSGGTEAVSGPLAAALEACGGGLLASGLEHEAVSSLAGTPLAWPATPEGRADLSWLEKALAREVSAGRRPVVSLMLVNNETGVVQPVAEAARLVRAVGGLIHCDAVQALGRISVAVTDLDVDYLSLSAHKVGGPQGMGAFFIRPGAPFHPRQTGGGQELGRRAGTEAVALAAGFAAAAEAALRDMDAYRALAGPRDRMEARLQAAAPDLRIHGQGAGRVAGVSCFGVDGLSADTQIMALDLAGFALSAGAACSSGKVRASRVLTAMGLSDTAARCAVRASFGWGSRPGDMDALAEAWIGFVRRARPQLLSRDALADAER